MNISIHTINSKDQRYPTNGDWYFDDKGDLTINISNTGDWRYDSLLAVHELVEVLVCKHRGITQEEVDAFDNAHLESLSPGWDKDAPYYKEHQFADAIERLLCLELGCNWQEYERNLPKV